MIPPERDEIKTQCEDCGASFTGGHPVNICSSSAYLQCTHCGDFFDIGFTCDCPGDVAERKAKAASAAAALPVLSKIAQNDRKDAEFQDRERAVKDSELSTREGWAARGKERLSTTLAADAHKADGEDTPAAELTFADFGQKVTLMDVERLPSAFVRVDNETILYEGLANIIFGEPSSCKSFVALMAAIQRLRAGRRVIWWDNEDRATTLARRLQLLKATDLIGCPELAFRTGEMQDSQTAMFEALDFLNGGNGPGLVVVDSATALGCPKDGADVAPWMKTHIKPWILEGHTTTQVDHVPKQRKDRPPGAVGSFEKLSDIRGAALYVHGKGWNQQQGGAVHLTVHKDAGGQLPVIKDSVVSTITAEWDGPTLAYTIGLPNAKTESEDLELELMEAFDKVGAEGVRGSQGVRDLLKGKRSRDVDKAKDELLQAGMIKRDKDGRAWVWKAVEANVLNVSQRVPDMFNEDD